MSATVQLDVNCAFLPTAKSFGAKRAFIIFVAYLLAQLAVGLLVGLGMGIYYGAGSAARGLRPDPQAIGVLIQTNAIIPIAILSALLGVYVAYRFVRPCFPGSINAGAFAPLGWTRCSGSRLWIAAGIGLTISLLYILVLVPLFPPDANRTIGPLATAAVSTGWTKHAWALMAVLIAPISEEFVFRGALYSGFARSWGRIASAIIVSILFVALHLTEINDYWPALVGISTLAVATVVTRQTSGSLIPSIALHAAYNLGLVLFVYGLAGQ